MLLEPPGPLEVDDLDWGELRLAAQRGGAVVRLADRLTQVAGDEPIPSRFTEAAAAACATAQHVVEIAGRLSARCNELGLGHAFLRTLDAYPDAPPTIELLVGHPKSDIDARMFADLPAVRRRAFAHHWIANVTSYTAAYGTRIFVRHGRLGRLGEHARFARLLLTRALPGTFGATRCAVPSRADHLLLLAMHQLYTRPAFRLSDLYGAIEAIRTGQIDWDYVYGTALSLGIVPAVGSYLHYADRMHLAATQRPLLPVELLTRFEAAPDDMISESAYFPRLQAAGRLYLQHLRWTLESGRWHSAARLSLLPLLAVLRAGGTPLPRTANQGGGRK